MRVELHGIVAECPACHGTEFEPGKPGAIQAHAPMTCLRCATRTTYILLLVQIGDKAIERASETLERIKAQRAKLRPKPIPPVE